MNLERRVKPIIKWAGGKSQLITQLEPFFPRTCKRYFEPFFGGGAVFFSGAFDLYLPATAYLNDLNTELIELYEVVRDSPRELMTQLDFMACKYSEEYYYELRAERLKTKVGRAARTVFLNKTGFNGLYRQNAEGGFNVPFGKRAHCPQLYDKENIEEASTVLQDVILSASDFEEVLEQAGARDFVYCDPPYEPLSRTSSFNAYQGGGFSQADQVRLKEACIRAHARGAHIVVSNSSADFIKELYSNCDVREVFARRAINSKGSSRGAIKELAVVFHGKW
jgi:DNA adenine methylase